jgi:hypothetical protein
MKPRKIVGLVYLLCILCCPIKCCTAEPSVVTSLGEQYCLEGYVYCIHAHQFLTEVLILHLETRCCSIVIHFPLINCFGKPLF